MFFTQEDYIKIQQWLAKNSVKDTEFNEANIPFNGNEIVSIVQGNQNKRVFLKDLVSQIFNLGVSDFVNITDKYDAPNISLEEAIRLIPSRARKEGQVITFLDMEDHWHIYQFKGALNQWNVLDTWEDLFDWEKLIINSILPDEEDLTKSPADENGNSYLSLKDREYNPKDFSGLGRVILRKNIVEIEDPVYGKVKKNILYQDMINKENTIYEIRYDFDLNGREITIPEGCVLDFQGGSLNNGNISGDNYNIKSSGVKIFDNIKFYGYSSENNKYRIDWFISKYPKSIEDNSVDNSIEINSAFASGIKNFVFSSDKYYRVEHQLIINSDIDLFADETNIRLRRNWDSPCIFSDTICELLKYNFQTKRRKRSLHIGKLNFKVTKQYTDLSDIDKAIIHIENIDTTTLWGVDVYCNICGTPAVLSLEDTSYKSGLRYNYIGLKFTANGDGANMSYVNVHGYIQEVYCGVKTETNGNGWFTSLTLHGDTMCTRGGDFTNGGSPTIIYGTHQALKNVPVITDIFPYFVGNTIKLYGYVWDVGTGTNTDTNLRNADVMYGAIKDNLLQTEKDRNLYMPSSFKYYNYENEDDFNSPNLLTTFLSSVDYSVNPVSNLNYTIDDEDIFTTNKAKLNNSHLLFTNNFPHYQGESARTTSIRNGGIAYLSLNVGDSNNHIIKISFLLNKSCFGIIDSRRPFYIYYRGSDTIYNNTDALIFNVYNNKDNSLIRSISSNKNTYIDPESYFKEVFSEEAFDFEYRIELICTVNTGGGNNIILPWIYIPSKTNLNHIPGGVSNRRPTNVNYYGRNRGLIWYDVTIGEPLYMDNNGNLRRFDNTNPDAKKKDNTANRPQILGTSDSGFQYYDTTLNKPIWWTGTKWVDATGADV